MLASMQNMCKPNFIDLDLYSRSDSLVEKSDNFSALQIVLYDLIKFLSINDAVGVAHEYGDGQLLFLEP